MVRNPIIKKLREQVEYETRLKNGLREELTATRAKLERFEAHEKMTQGADSVYRGELESQVIWLRNLVEKMAIHPEIVRALTEKEVQRKELDHEIEIAHWEHQDKITGDSRRI